MTYCIFKEQICKAVEGLLREQQPDIRVKTESFARNNGVIGDVLILTKENLRETPAVYLEDLYRDYKKGKSLEELAADICRIYQDCQGRSGFDPEKFLDYTHVQERIIYRLVNREKNRELLEQVPYLPFLDLAILFCYLTEENAQGSGTILIRWEHLQQWSVDVDRLWDDAYRNTPKLCKVELFEIEHYMRQAGLLVGPETAEPSFYILTNRQQCYGAAAILYPQVLKHFGERIQKAFYVLPSSVHEVILVPEKEGMDSESFHEIVKEANQVAVREEEFLADHAYFYEPEIGLHI